MSNGGDLMVYSSARSRLPQMCFDEHGEKVDALTGVRNWGAYQFAVCKRIHSPTSNKVCSNTWLLYDDHWLPLGRILFGIITHSNEVRELEDKILAAKMKQELNYHISRAWYLFHPDHVDGVYV